jgi:hypothetical protein
MLMNAPGYLFTLPAVAFILLGLVIIAGSLEGVVLWSATFGLQTLVVGVLLTIVGYQVGSLALFTSVAADPIRHPKDPITNTIHNQFTLESGAKFGVLTFGVGASYLTYGAVAYTITGYAAVPPVAWNLIAACAVLIGVQTVFKSFFLSIMVQHPAGT